MNSDNEVQYVATPSSDPSPMPGPPQLPGERWPLWKKLLYGFAPSLALLLIMLVCFTLDRGGETLMPIVVIAAGAYVLLTPVLMVPWSIRTMNDIHGPAAPDKQAGRAGLVTLVTIGMTFANYCIVFAGCTCLVILTIN